MFFALIFSPSIQRVTGGRFEFEPTIKAKIRELWDDFVERGVFFVRKRCKELDATMDNCLVESLHRLLDCYFKNYHPHELKPKAALNQL